MVDHSSGPVFVVLSIVSGVLRIDRRKAKARGADDYVPQKLKRFLKSYIKILCYGGEKYI